jgi:hypothetical protein
MYTNLSRLGMAVVLVCSGLQAQAVGRLADVTVIDRNTGATLPVYHSRGEYWVAGAPGARYAIAVRNRLGERVMAVTSVDGVNVLNGATASWSQTGYVFSPYANYQITGWRKSNSEVAAFEFAASQDSYAERTGRPSQVGVIGVALFKERVPQPIAAPAPPPYRQERELNESRRDSALPPPPPAAASPALQKSMGSAELSSAAPQKPWPTATARPPNWGRGTASAKTPMCRKPALSACSHSPTRSSPYVTTAARTWSPPA